MPAIMIRLIPILMIMAFATLAAPARAEMCRVADPTGTPLNVRGTPGGDVVNRLKNGRKVFIAGIDGWKDDGTPKWAHVLGEYKGEWRDWGWVFIDYLKCSGDEDTGQFPIIFESGQDMAQAGIIVPWAFNSGTVEPRLEHECFYYGDGGYTMFLSADLVRAYEARGHTLEELCIVLRSPRLKFDPETGKRLPTFIVIDPEGIALARQSGFYEGTEATEEMPLHAPDCFAKSTASKNRDGLHSLNVACDIRFDPWTGIELSPLEADYYRQNVALILDGGAGPSGTVGSEELIVSGQNRATNASIKTVMDIRNGQN